MRTVAAGGQRPRRDCQFFLIIQFSSLMNFDFGPIRYWFNNAGELDKKPVSGKSDVVFSGNSVKLGSNEHNYNYPS